MSNLNRYSGKIINAVLNGCSYSCAKNLWLLLNFYLRDWWAQNMKNDLMSQLNMKNLKYLLFDWYLFSRCSTFLQIWIDILQKKTTIVLTSIQEICWGQWCMWHALLKSILLDVDWRFLCTSCDPFWRKKQVDSATKLTWWWCCFAWHNYTLSVCNCCKVWNSDSLWMARGFIVTKKIKAVATIMVNILVKTLESRKFNQA